MKRKYFPKITPCELTTDNMDRCCALDNCPGCDFDLENHCMCWFKKLKIVAICEAPWPGGFNKERTKAIVYECPNCFEHFWFHTDIHTKQHLEDLLNMGEIK